MDPNELLEPGGWESGGAPLDGPAPEQPMEESAMYADEDLEGLREAMAQYPSADSMMEYEAPASEDDRKGEMAAMLAENMAARRERSNAFQQQAQQLSAPYGV